MMSMRISFRSLRTFWLASLVVVWLGSLTFSSFGDASQAQSIEREGLELPLICILGETCWVANYVDVDTRPRPPGTFAAGPAPITGTTGRISPSVTSL
jgi:hypothetical protein